jgi:hypothetical protein
MRLFFLLLFALVDCLRAQTATLRGVVTDETGAIVPKTVVAVTPSGGSGRSTVSADDGSYVFSSLPPASYTVQASAPDLALQKPVTITLRPGSQVLNLLLKVASTTQQVTVQDQAGPAVSVDAANNASALVLRGSDLDALSDDPEDLQADLLALAGPAAGPNGGQIMIDGFSGGQLPSKDSIREIRINQNPFSPEYDKLGFGRIEIFTKPGSDKFRGSFAYNFANDFWNSRNPYAAEKAPFSLNELSGNLSGPVGRKASFFLDAQREFVDNGSVINGAVVDPKTFGIINPYTDTSPARQRRTTISPRLDDQLSPNNTLILRYRFNRDAIEDAGAGGFNIASRAYHWVSTNQTMQISDTIVLGAAAVNETRFQYFRPVVEIVPNSDAPAIQVLGAFTGGGAQTGHSIDRQNGYEIQNYTSITHGVHFWRFGVRLRATMDDNASPKNFGGTYTFAGGPAPELGANSQPILDASGNAVLVSIASIERYQRTLYFESLGFTPSQIRTFGGGATQFGINAGNPAISASQIDLGAFVGDDWRLRPNLTLNLGFRFEGQTDIHDWKDFAARLGVAWAPGGGGKSRPQTVLRAGFGIFYDRFTLQNTINALRYNGVNQQQYVITDPTILNLFPAIPPPSALAALQSPQTIQQLSPTLRAPYIRQSAFSYERQLPAGIALALTYANSHGVHQFRSEDVNAPLPGTFSPAIPGSGVFPNGTPGPIFQMGSSGIYNQNQFITSVNARVSQRISLFGSYMLNRALSDTDGLGTFPANPYNFAGEYGPALTDIRNRMTFGGSIVSKWNIRWSPLAAIDSGMPFDITSGTDRYGSTLFNARPGIATNPNKPGLIETSYGLLDPNPTPDEAILPRNFGRGPAQFRVNLRVSKTFGFGPSREARGAAAATGTGAGDRGRGANVFGVGGGPQNTNAGPTSRRFNLTISMSALNVINHNNPGPIIGNITSPLFGRANQPAGGAAGNAGFSENANNRRLELQTRVTF